MYLLGQKIHTAPVDVLTFLCWTSNCSTVLQRSSSSKAGTTITYYLGSFSSVSQFEGYFQSKNYLRNSWRNDCCSPGKICNSSLDIRYLGITSAKLRDLIWSSFYQKSTLAKKTLWFSEMTTQQGKFAQLWVFYDNHDLAHILELACWRKELQLDCYVHRQTKYREFKRLTVLC